MHWTRVYQRRFRATNTINTEISSPYTPLGKSLFASLTLLFLKNIHRHGLSYTTFDLADLTLAQPTVENGEFHLSASVKVTNTGSVPGSEVVQLYISLPTTSNLTHPKLQLKGFAKVYDLAPGASHMVDITLDKYAVSYWSELYDSWTVENGVYVVKVGSASDRLSLEAAFEVKTGFEWAGL